METKFLKTKWRWSLKETTKQHHPAGIPGQKEEGSSKGLLGKVRSWRKGMESEIRSKGITWNTMGKACQGKKLKGY